MESNHTTLDEVSDRKSTWFKESIISKILETRPDFYSEVDVEFDYVTNDDNTLTARQYSITTPIGAIVIFPDFNHSDATGTVIRLGLVECMLKEGYDLDHIVENAPIYGKLVPATNENSDLLAYYLTHRIDGTDSKS